MAAAFRIGHGFDVHQLRENRDLIIGGVKIPFEKGLYGHSDADVLLHAICDAILGALALGDIGKIFPDTDSKFKNIDSSILLSRVVELMEAEHYRVLNIDSTIAAQAPKLSPYILEMRENIARLLRVELSQTSVKATTTEHLGFEGRGEGISATAVVLLEKF